MATNQEREPFWSKRQARYTATCERCGAPVEVGDEVFMKPEVKDDGRKIWHVICAMHGEPAQGA